MILFFEVLLCMSNVEAAKDAVLQVDPDTEKNDAPSCLISRSSRSLPCRTSSFPQRGFIALLHTGFESIQRMVFSKSIQTLKNDAPYCLICVPHQFMSC